MTVLAAVASDISQNVIGSCLLLAGATAALVLLRLARYSFGGRAVVAGMIAGTLLGPSVLDRVLPHAFERMFLGSAVERADLEVARSLASGVPLTIEGLSQEDRDALIERGLQDVESKAAALDAAERRHQTPLRWLTVAAVVIVLSGACRSCSCRRDARQRMLTPLSIGIWSFALPAAAAYVCSVRWWGASMAEGAMLAAAVGIGPWSFGQIDRDAADGAEFGGAHMMQVAGRIASLLAFALAIWASWHSDGVAGIAITASLLALPLAWILAALLQRTKASRDQLWTAVDDSRWQAWIVDPSVALLSAIICLHIDLHTQLDWIMLVMVISLALIADDGRLVGGLTGAMLLGGRPLLRTMRLVMPAMAAGPTQLAVAALAIQCGFLPARFALPLIAGVLLIELSAPARRSMARRLIEAEAEFDAE